MLVISIASGLIISNLDNDLNIPNQTTKSLLVLPFINATNDPTMDWLEHGLSDMLAIDLQRSKPFNDSQLEVTPPALANTLLINAELD